MRKVALCTLVSLMTLGMSFSSFAASWKQDGRGWWYDWGNGTWPANSWQWIDGDGDGTAECYYFDMYGYCILGGTTPDSYEVNQNGAWIIDGVVQTRNVKSNQSHSAVNSKKITVNNDDEEDDDASESSKNAKNNDRGKSVSLYSLYAVRGNAYKSSQSTTNRENKVLPNVLEFNHNDYMEYVVDGKYSTLKAEIAPLKDSWGVADEIYLEVYGDGEMLYTSDTLYYDSRITPIEVDVSGCDKVELVVRSTHSWRELLLANARFVR